MIGIVTSSRLATIDLVVDRGSIIVVATSNIINSRIIAVVVAVAVVVAINRVVNVIVFRRMACDIHSINSDGIHGSILHFY